MQIVDWTAADESTRQAILRRPAQAAHEDIRREAAEIIAAVRAEGDTALRDFTRRFDGAAVAELQIPLEDREAALADLDPEIRGALDTAINSLRRYHGAGMQEDYVVETAAGVECRRLIRPLDTVGLYVPGGSSPLVSTVLMLAVPARLAGCGRIVLCTPPHCDGVHPLILAAAALCGVHTIIAAGGAQAIAAMAYGTASVPRVDKIFGPGNAWVTAAKLAISADAEGVPCDLPAGPSEVLVIADAGAEPGFVAADLLSQAEHGADSQVLLVTDSREMAVRVCAEIKAQLVDLPRASIARAALAASRVLVTCDLDEAIRVSNAYAPEHLILAVRRPEALLKQVSNAGSVFLGDWTPEVLGDYVSGTNHVLPTYGFARSLSGLAVQDFQKRIAIQCATPSGLATLGPAAVTLAEAESLEAHARAVGLRLTALEQEARRAQLA